MADELIRECCKCFVAKPIWDFPLNSRIASGRDVRCYACVRESREKFDSKWRDKEKKMRGMKR